METLSTRDRIYLERPANLHNGFDFLVCVENQDYDAGTGKRARKAPKHDDIYDDLESKKAEDPEKYKRFVALIRKVFECHDVTDEEIHLFDFKSGLASDHVVKALKWLFIEQDIRYWNYSGRNMTWGVVPLP